MNTPDDEIKQLHAERAQFAAFLELMVQDVAVVCRVGGSPFFVPKAISTTPSFDQYGFNIMCSDTFRYACADAEAIRLSDAPEILRLWNEQGWGGVDRWVQEKRGGPDKAPFIGPVTEFHTREKSNLQEIERLRAENEKLRTNAIGPEDKAELQKLRGVDGDYATIMFRIQSENEKLRAEIEAVRETLRHEQVSLAEALNKLDEWRLKAGTVNVGCTPGTLPPLEWDSMEDV